MAKKHVRCPNCRSLTTQRFGFRRNKTGLIRRFLCLSCHHSFSLRQFVHAQITPTRQVDITRRHIEDRTAIRELVRDTGHSSASIVKAIHTVTSQCASAAWIAQQFAPTWGGYLALDGTTVRVWDWSAKYFRYTKQARRWLHKMTLLIALDIQTLDLPTHRLSDEETTIDLVLLLRELRAIHYPLKGVISDGNPDIPKAVKLVFGPGIPHQLCQLHYLRSLRQKVAEGKIPERHYREATQSIPRGKRPVLFSVPDELFTYLNHPGLPRTNQALEVTNRWVKLRLKTIGVFHSWQSATWYCQALMAYRRFLKFTDRKRQPNGQAPLELANCLIDSWDYLTKTHRKLKR